MHIGIPQTLDKDLNSSQKKESNYSFALNATMEHYSEDNAFPFLSNMPSNIKVLDFEENEKLYGILTIPELNSTILAFINEKTKLCTLVKASYNFTKYPEPKHYEKNLGECVRVVYTDEQVAFYETKVLLKTHKFNWNITSPIDFVYKITDCTLNIYFVNGLDQDRYIYFNLDDYKITDEFLLNSEFNADYTLWYPQASYPVIGDAVINNGTKESGKYFYMLAYSTNKGIPLSSYLGLTQGISIFYKKNEVPNKGIVLDIQNISTNSRYKFYTIVCIEQTETSLSYKHKGVYSINTTKVYDLDNEGTSIPLSELVTQYPYYEHSDTIAISNNILFRANVSEFEKLNLQPLINQIELEWVTIVQKEGEYKNNNDFVSYMRDEVYAFSLEPIIDNLEKAPAYLVSNREKILTRDYTEEQPLLWQTQNTAQKSFQSNALLSDLTNTKQVYQKGSFGYYESLELYPNVPEVWGDLANQSIRHFKFPDNAVTKHHSNSSYDDPVYTFPIGVRIKTDLQVLFNQAVVDGLLTKEQRNRIIGWKLLRSNRLGNKSVIAKGLFYDVWKYNEEKKDKNFFNTCNTTVQPRYFSNYPFNDLRPDKLLAKNRNHYEGKPIEHLEFEPTGRYTFHSADTHFIQPDLGDVVKIENLSTGQAKGFFNIAEEESEQKILNNKHYNLIIMMSKWIALLQDAPGEIEIQNKFEQVGSKVGEIAGGALGLGSTISAIGGVLGHFIGGRFYNNSSITQFTDSLFRSSIIFSEADKFASLFTNLINYKQYHYQYQAVGKYNVLQDTTPSSKNIEFAEYLQEGNVIINKDFVNNNGRESSVYIKVPVSFPAPIGDNSKVLISESLKNPDGSLKYDPSNPTIYTETVSTPIECFKYSVSIRSKKKVRAGVWGRLCNKIQLSPTDISNMPIGIANVAGETYYKTGYMPGFILSRDIYLVEIVSPTEHYITDELFYVINTYGLSNSTMPDIQESTYCYKYVYIKPTVAYIDNASEEDNRVIGEEEIVITQKRNCTEGGDNVVLNESTITYFQSSCTCNVPVQTNIASYYGSIKKFNPVQYGNVYDINWITTNVVDNNIFFGGDTYIGRMSLKRKHRLFNLSTFKTANDFPINYTDYVNAGYPIYYFDKLPYKKDRVEPILDDLTFPIKHPSDYVMRKLLPIFKNSILDVESYITKPKYNFDCTITESPTKVEFSSAAGLMYLYYYGIISFVTESEINLDLRGSGKELDTDFYPNQSDLTFWLQEKNIPINTDNFYIYNKAYSKQPTEEFHYMLDVNFKGVESCKIDYQNKLLYSPQVENIDNDDYADKFLINKALDYHDFSKIDGKITSIHSLEGSKILIRQEHSSSIIGAFVELNTDQHSVSISTGNMFKSKPIQFAVTPLGYFGSQHKSFISTPYGHISVDALRGTVHLLKPGSKGLEEISNKGLKNWFKENLPFTINRYFHDINIDNNFNGVGLVLGYDNRFNTLFITKLDFIPLTTDLRYNKKDNYFYLESTKKHISLYNEEYFCNKSWTISYNLTAQQWVSFHSFYPKAYINYIATYDTVNNIGIWKHNITNKSYQHFFGKLEPFSVEVSFNSGTEETLINSISYILEVQEHINQYDTIFKDDISFNKAIVYNKYQNSGLLKLDILKNNLFLKSKYPIFATDSTKIELTIKDEYHSFNQFKNIIHSRNLPIWFNECNNAMKQINPMIYKRSLNTPSLDYIRSTSNTVRLINDKESLYKFIFKGLITNDISRTRI